MQETEEQEVLVEQTRFNQIEPLFDRDDKAPVIEPHLRETTGTPPGEAQKPRPKNKPLIIGGAVLGTLVVLLIIVAALSRQPKKANEELPPPPTAEAIKQQTDLEKRIGDVKQQLENSDPTKQDLVFPPVDMKIRLDKKEN